jgi:purine-binding chemotaxis protein CheW
MAQLAHIIDVNAAHPLAKAAKEWPSRVCVLSVSGESFVADLTYVREVFEVASITPVPGMPSMVSGVSNLRGAIVPIADLRPALGLAVHGSPGKYAVVIRHGDNTMAVLVDKLPEIRDVLPDEFVSDVSQAMGGAPPFVRGLWKQAGILSGLLDVPALISYVEA